MRVGIIGAGAAGLVAGIYASLRHDVTILERNNVVGKKLLITGNGKCNYFNSDMGINHYNDERVLSLLNDGDELLSLFDRIGIIPKVENGYYYPFSGNSYSVQEALLLECQLNNVDIMYNFCVKSIIKEDKFLVSSEDEVLEFDKIIITTGSKAYPKTGSDGNGYDLLSSLGHRINPVILALTYLVGDNAFQSGWNGVRCDASIKLYHDSDFIKEESGEIQLTKNGVSGICIFNLSRYITTNNRLEINFVPWCHSISDVLLFFDKRSNKVTGRNLDHFFEGFLHYKLVRVILDILGLDKEKYYDELNKKEKYNLARYMFSFPFDVIDVGPFDRAQVCRGGVFLDEINMDNMESLKVNGLFIAGEVLDVDGDCGGYNLMFAFLSGMRAGKSV